MSTELVSCIIPTANRPSLLERAIKSAFNQTYNNIEVIVVASPPHGVVQPVVDKYATSEIPVETIYIGDESGPGAARNRGLEAARGEYIAFLDDDDEWKPSKIEKQVPYIADYSLVCCLCILKKDGEQSLQEASGSTVHEVDLETAFGDFSTIYPSGSIFRANELHAVGGFDEDLTRGDMYDLALRIINRYDPAYVLEDHLVIFDRKHSMGRVSNRTTEYEDRLTAYYRHHNKVSRKTARRRFVKLKYNEYTELNGPEKYKTLIRALLSDYELYILRRMLRSFAITCRDTIKQYI